MAIVFFRNDDVFEANKNFMLLNKIFFTRKIPIHHSVIPNKLSESASKELIKLKMRYPELIEYGQHGYSHKNYGNGRIKFEFLNRTYQQQKGDIHEGKKIMKYLLGEHFAPAFTPPYHKYNEDTLRAVEGLHFRIFSADRKTKFDMKKYKFSSVPVSIAFSKNLSETTKHTSDIKALIKSFVSLEGRIPFIGISLHHNMFDTKDFKNLKLFLNYTIKINSSFCKLSTVGGRK